MSVKQWLHKNTESNNTKLILYNFLFKREKIKRKTNQIKPLPFKRKKKIWSGCFALSLKQSLRKRGKRDDI